jgi:hypothetical protein
VSFLQFVACAGIGLVFGFIGGALWSPLSRWLFDRFRG